MSKRTGQSSSKRASRFSIFTPSGRNNPSRSTHLIQNTTFVSDASGVSSQTSFIATNTQRKRHRAVSLPRISSSLAVAEDVSASSTSFFDDLDKDYIYAIADLDDMPRRRGAGVC